jgi:hypothetical protein
VIIGALSERDVEKISLLLKGENISFTVEMDTSMMEANDYSLKNDLRHLSSPSISTHILSINLPEGSFSKMSDDLKKNLLEFGITNEIPVELDLTSLNPEPIQHEIINGNKRLVGKNFLYECILTVIVSIVIYFLFGEFNLPHWLN